MKNIIVTGGAGFIGSNFAAHHLRGGGLLVNLDKLTYAGNPENLRKLEGDSRHLFVQGDIGDRALLRGLFKKYKPSAVINFAAESHVDRSIDSPNAFVQTNILGLFSLLEEARYYWNGLDDRNKRKFRFLQISTDEVYWSLGRKDPLFTEESSYRPNSPYAASKAAADHMIRAYHRTYDLPALTTNCSNNYGPYQHPEKLIPLMIHNALKARPLPVYGDGGHIRDWLFVGDHCAAISKVLEAGRPGESYNIGGRCEMSNLEVVRKICSLLDGIRPLAGASYARLINFVKDRPGHDRRYAINCGKIEGELGWKPMESFDSGIAKTIRWYMDNSSWVDAVAGAQGHKSWVASHYGAAAPA